ncbi:hypothetical protein BHE90_005631 [Fusarium euwallaceae]|uniref:Transcription factor domain-containing protein n=1 Tax=Fusarium euwallaceae TaxID=1147111 RepID=A0A430LVW6_9HYPO|nr:hypothetical protein BHE90_005631 [Fusarium euwallaceae]
MTSDNMPKLSRNGCLTCKRRKVKDGHAENSPVAPNHLSTSASPIPATEQPRQANKTLVTTFIPKVGVSQCPITLDVPHGCGLWSYDMELMHHYTTTTATTLSIRKDMAHLWQVTIPREGYRNPFVLHGILAMSAVHLAYLRPTNRKMYLQLYNYHSTLGSEQFRSTLEDARPENWMGLFSFAALITLHAFTLPLRLNDQKLPDPLLNLFEVATLLRGMETMLSPMLPLISRSEFAPFIYGVRLSDSDDLSARQVIT